MKIQRSLDQYFLKAKNNTCSATKLVPKKPNSVDVDFVQQVPVYESPDLKKKNTDCLLGQTFYVDNSLESIRNDLVALVIEFRGKIVHSLGNHLNFMIMDSLVDEHRKAKALEHGYRIIRVAQFFEMIRIGGRVESVEQIKEVRNGDEPQINATPPKAEEEDVNEILIDLTVDDDESIPKAIATIARPLQGVGFLVMKSLEMLSRNECVRQIELLGGKLVNKIGKGVDYMVVTEGAAGILSEKSMECGIQVIMEQAFDEFMENKRNGK